MKELFEVITENGEILVINKPQDLVCHPTKGDEYSSLISRARLYLKGEAFLVNRLDRETSGVVLVAKSAAVAGELGKLFEKGNVRKEYDAIVHGWVEADEGSIDAPLGKDETSPVAIKDRVRPGGASAVTFYTVGQRFVREGARFTLLRVKPRSGRKHQIRLHLAHLGHPIVGDKLYGGDETIYLRLATGALTERDREVLLLQSHALHASHLSFSWRDRDWQFETAMPQPMRDFIPASRDAISDPEAGPISG